MSQKTISINPDFLNFSNTGGTRKKKEKNNNEIKIKPKLPRKNDTLKKQSLLRMIRKHQQDRYKDVVSENKSKPLNYSFEQTKDFLNSLNNKTVKQQDNIEKNLENEIRDIKQYEPVYMHTSAPNLLQQPKYGCLKNGNLPTYRMTMKNRDFNINTPPSIQQTEIIEKKYPILNKESQAIYNLTNQVQRQKQKKIHRRTYCVGKDKNKPNVSVLISNKKIRTNVTMKLQQIKQDPIDKVRKELIKKGLIRVGSLTPENILRKMYETVHMICGDVKNHNPDNLLFNYFNS